LAFVKENAGQLWIYPLVATAAYTGARRSELLRIKLVDLDLSGETVLLTEKKRSREKTTTRRVPLPAVLVEILKAWVAVHPGGAFLFAANGEVFRSKKRSRTTGHLWGKKRPGSLKARQKNTKSRQTVPLGSLTRDEVHDHLKRTLAGSKWANLRGLHCLRHSYISALASRAVDQRLIDDFVGHQSDEQRHRYRHLYPDVKREAVRSVFSYA
jgi:integrase